MEEQYIYSWTDELPEEEREGCNLAILVCRFLRSEVDDTYGRHSWELEDQLETIRNWNGEDAVRAADWVRANMTLGVTGNDALALLDRVRERFAPEIIAALEITDGKGNPKWPPLGMAVIRTSKGRLVGFLSRLVFVNLDDPDVGLLYQG